MLHNAIAVHRSPPHLPFWFDIACRCAMQLLAGGDSVCTDCARQRDGFLHLCLALLQAPPGLEEAVCALAKHERAIVSCPAALAGSKRTSGGPGREANGGAAGPAHEPALVPPPPPDTDRVEFDLHLLSMLQVLSASTLWLLVNVIQCVLLL